MRNALKSTVLTAGLAIFSMLFGAANLMYPPLAGLNSGTQFIWGIAGFLFTAVLIPVIGLVGIIYFDGDYKRFFFRLGTVPGKCLIGFSMAVIGPFYAMPRIVMVCRGMIAPFLPESLSLIMFSVIFCGLTFLATFRESKIIALLGHLISPALLISLSIILVKGILHPQPLAVNTTPGLIVFAQQAVLGYSHLDLLGTIFFGSIVLSLLKASRKNQKEYNTKQLALTGMQAGLIGCTLLGIAYGGMALLGAFYGTGLESSDPAQLFSAISFKVLGTNGALIIATAVTMACFSTIIALATVLAEYLQHDISGNKLNYIPSLSIILFITTIVSCSNLNAFLDYAKPIIETAYPLLITLTLVNIAYKLYGFKWVKAPVAATLLFSLYINWPSYAIYTQLLK